jgi:small ligand-binding sensory domain FIST
LTVSPFAAAWRNSRRVGLHFHDSSGKGVVWQHGRCFADGCAEARVVGARPQIALSLGLKPVGEPQVVESACGYDLLASSGQGAVEALQRALPADWRNSPPWHLINALVEDSDGAPLPVAIISANSDGSLTLAAELRPGQRLIWAIRQALCAEADMRTALDTVGGAPMFGLFFSCIGRGPYFYGGEDRDLLALLERHPGLPVLGAYGTGQIVCHGRVSRQIQNSVITALYSRSPDVQP